MQRNPRVRGSWSRVWGECQHTILWSYIRITSVSIHIATTTDETLNLKPTLLVTMLLGIAEGTLQWKIRDQDDEIRRIRESMQQLALLDTARSETMECYKIGPKCINSGGKRQIQNEIDLREVLWARETEQPPQTLVFTKKKKYKNTKKKIIKTETKTVKKHFL